MKRKILILDSGIGGLNVLKQLYLKLNFYNFIYFADIINLPYGNKTRKELLNITINNLSKLICKYKPYFIVIGCNTIGSSILEEIKKHFYQIKIFAIKPNINYVIKQLTINKKQLKNQSQGELLNGNLLVLTTAATKKAIAKKSEYILNKNNIVLCKMPSLANKVENNIQNISNIVPYLKRRLCKFKRIVGVVLGCTHYIYLKKQIKDMFIDSKVFDGSESLINEIKKSLSLKNIGKKQKPKLQVKFIYSFARNKQVEKKYKMILNQII